MSSTCRVFSLVAVLAFWVSAVVAGDFESNRRTLQGIRSLNVIIGDLDSDGRKSGLTEEQLRTDVELKLRLAGITIDPKSVQFLYLGLTILPTENGVYAFGLE